MDHVEGHNDHHLDHHEGHNDHDHDEGNKDHDRDEGDNDHHELPDEEIPHAFNTRCSNRCNLEIEKCDAGVSIIHIDILIQDDILKDIDIDEAYPIHINIFKTSLSQWWQPQPSVRCSQQSNDL